MLRKLITEFYYRYYQSGFKIYKHLKKIQRTDIKHINERQILAINQLLTYSYNNVPYYHKAFKKSGLVSNGKIKITSLEDMTKIPILTKDIIRREGEKLYSSIPYKNSKRHFNTSGGSTGEPLTILQDDNFNKNKFGNYLLINGWRKPNIFDSEVFLWGALRDTYGKKNSVKGKVIDFLLNRKTFNSAKMTEDDMLDFIRRINRKRPALIFGYVNSIYEIAVFAEKNNLKILPQKRIHTGAGTLHDFMREKIEKVFSCKIFNHYGGREVGGIASECAEHNGLHILADFNYVEIINDANNLIIDEEEGEILVTTLTNFSMPLIRYKIGDRAQRQTYSICSCGCNYPKLSKISGRSSDNFKNVLGEVISGEYLTLTFNKIRGVEKFQIVQNSLFNIDIYLVKNNNYDQNIEFNLEEKFKKLFSDAIKVNFNYVHTIETTPTGKHLYTICKIK